MLQNMAIGNHPNGEFLQPKSKKSFNVEDYPIYDCAIYVMKWLEIIEPQNIKKGSMSGIIGLRDATIKGSEIMRLSRPSTALLIPYYQVDSYDIESDSD
ncbi:hypothetical protein Ahy_B03g066585 [Arachis hypogaea]|uniref:Ubiquitin-like protease family profile domain-containing protein n=1 Tax=Arachis hypogaea TaxID=3818 RepID=A0A445A4L2_ARAHY|nr:hypothetical protein Ahy_B03g066585 [Arachis hypogaea]